MWLIPSKRRWRSWSLPSKLTAIGTYIGAIALVLTLPTIPFSSFMKPSMHAHLRARLFDRYSGFQVQVINEDSSPAKQITVTLKTWQIHAPGFDVEREFNMRDLAPNDDFSFHIEPFDLTGDAKYDQDRAARPTCGYIVVRSIDSNQPRAWAFFIPGTPGVGQALDPLFSVQDWPIVEFDYPKKVPKGTQCIDYPTGVCKAAGFHDGLWKPERSAR